MGGGDASEWDDVPGDAWTLVDASSAQPDAAPAPAIATDDVSAGAPPAAVDGEPAGEPADAAGDAAEAAAVGGDADGGAGSSSCDSDMPVLVSEAAEEAPETAAEEEAPEAAEEEAPEAAEEEAPEAAEEEAPETAAEEEAPEAAEEEAPETAAREPPQETPTGLEAPDRKDPPKNAAKVPNASAREAAALNEPDSKAKMMRAMAAGATMTLNTAAAMMNTAKAVTSEMCTRRNGIWAAGIGVLIMVLLAFSLKVDLAHKAEHHQYWKHEALQARESAAHCTAEKQHLVEQYSHEQQENEALHDQKLHLKNQVGRLQRENDQMSERLREQDRRIATLQRENAALRADDQGSSDGACKGLEDEVSELRDDNAQLLSEVMSYISKTDALQSEFEKAFANVRKELDEVRAANSHQRQPGTWAFSSAGGASSGAWSGSDGGGCFSSKMDKHVARVLGLLDNAVDHVKKKSQRVYRAGESLLKTGETWVEKAARKIDRYMQQ